MTDDRQPAQTPDDALAEAAEQLRRHTDPGWVDARGRVRRTAMRATRRSRPLRLERTHRRCLVTDEVVVTLLRERVDGVAHVAPVDITVLGEGERCDGVRIGLLVEFGHPIGELAVAARGALLDTLRWLFPESAETGDLHCDIEVRDVAVVDGSVVDGSPALS